MARNLLIIAKVVPGIDAHVDAVIGGLQNVRDFFGLMSNTQSGRTLLYWACWYDPWLMGDSLDPESWGWTLSATPIVSGIWRLSLTEGNWKAIQSEVAHKTQFKEQHWLCWQLSNAFESYRAQNDKAHLYCGRDVMGASLDDVEVTARAINTA